MKKTTKEQQQGDTSARDHNSVASEEKRKHSSGSQSWQEVQFKAGPDKEGLVDEGHLPQVQMFNS